MSLRKIVVGGIVGLYLLGIGFLGGLIVSAIRFDQRRDVILSDLEDSSARVRARLMLLEHDASRTAAPR